MNKAVAHILKEQLTGLPLIEKVAGLVQVAEYQETVYDDNGVPTTYTKRILLSQDVQYDKGCENTDLVPDDNKTGFLYFEDGGTTGLSLRRISSRYRSKLRLVVWLNPKRTYQQNYNVVPVLLAHCINRVQALNGTNVGLFQGIRVTIDGLPKQDKNIFAPYTYDHFNTGFILPPYEYFAIDLSMEYTISIKEDCIPDLITDEIIC